MSAWIIALCILVALPLLYGIIGMMFSNWTPEDDDHDQNV